MKIGSFQKEPLMRQDRLGISVGYHCIDKGVSLTRGFSRLMVLFGGGGLRDMGGLMGTVSAFVQRSSSPCRQRLDTYSNCSLLLGRTCHRDNNDPFKNCWQLMPARTGLHPSPKRLGMFSFRC